MIISSSTGNTKFRPVNVTEFDDILKVITKNNYSLGLFKDNYRKASNFVKATMVGLDFDGGYSLDAALRDFAKHQHIIATTKSHRKDKNGVVDDRFRVILFTDEIIDNADDYKSTVKDLQKSFPHADPACCDASRMFYPSTNIISAIPKGKQVKRVQYVPLAKPLSSEVQEGQRGDLLKSSLQFFLMGAKPGTANDALYRAAKDAQAQSYTRSEVEAMVQKMIDAGGRWASKGLNEKDHECLDSVFSSEPKDNPRVPESPFRFQAIGEVLSSKIKLNWTVDKLFIAGGISLIAGPPKSGKSTIVRQLAKSVVRGDTFLGRSTKSGSVLYLALEEHIAMLRDQFKTIGVTSKDNILLHVGGITTKDPFTPLGTFIAEFKPALIIIDTLSLFASFRDINDYENVNGTMEKIRGLARNSGAHIALVHHSNKSQVRDFNAIMGSQAIFGSVDAVFFFDAVGNQRYAKTTGRGTKNLDQVELIYDEDRDTYSIGQSNSEGF